jgi:hypothetical protein
MALTRETMIIRAVQLARGGRSPEESGIFEDDADLLVENAAHALSSRIAMDERRRHLLQKNFVVTVVDGAASLSGAAYENILHAALQWASFYDPDDVSNNTYTSPYIYKREAQSLHRYLNPNFGYWALRIPLSIETYARNISDNVTARSALNGTAIVRANYVFDFSGNYPLPTGGELDDEAVQELAMLLKASQGS